MSEKCPTCERPVSRPLPAMRTTPWTDDCACSDYSPCLAHQVTGDGPSRPLDDVMRERTHAVHAQRLAEYERILQRCNALRLSDEERKALRNLADFVEHGTRACRSRATTVALEAIARLTGETP